MVEVQDTCVLFVTISEMALNSQLSHVHWHAETPAFLNVMVFAGLERSISACLKQDFHHIWRKDWKMDLILLRWSIASFLLHRCHSEYLKLNKIKRRDGKSILPNCECMYVCEYNHKHAHASPWKCIYIFAHIGIGACSTPTNKYFLPFYTACNYIAWGWGGETNQPTDFFLL